MQANEVRGNSSLMLDYIQLYKEVYGKELNCASCTFKSDFTRLKQHLANNKQSTNNSIMGFKIKKRNVILSYKKDGLTYRKYDNIANDQFLSEFLTHGTSEELEERRKLFTSIPDDFEATKKENEVNEVEEIKEVVTEEKPKATLKKGKATKKENEVKQ